MINHSQFCFRGILWFSHKIVTLLSWVSNFWGAVRSAAGQLLRLLLHLRQLADDRLAPRIPFR